MLGAGFAGLKIVRRLIKSNAFNVILIDRHNYHQFQPLLYQIATAGLEPSSISFPLRKAFHQQRKTLQQQSYVHIRLAEINEVDLAGRQVITSVGAFSYDKLIIALGVNTNFFGNAELERHCFSMKSVPEALLLRNELLSNYERAVTTEDEAERKALLNVVIVGGGATGVELAGAIAEMKNTILHKDYPELDFSAMQVYLVEAGPRLLPGLSEFASEKSKKYLEKLGVVVQLDTLVKSYDGNSIVTSAVTLHSKCVVWAAGVKASTIKGIPAEWLGRAGRIKVDAYNRAQDNVFAIGDIAFMTEEKYPNGHPQVAPVAIQQADNLAKNLLRELNNQPWTPFAYKNQGSMATVGRNLAVVELPGYRFGGFFAWLVWMFVHLMSIVGVKNRLWVFFNWVWNYITYDVSLRLIIRPANRKD